MCNADNKKWEKRNIRKNRTAKSRKLGEKDNYKLGILEPYTFNQTEIKERKKKEKIASKEKENFSRPKSAAVILSY